MITLTVGATTLTLPPDLDWTDEYAWAPVVQEANYSLTGALVVESATRQTGRPITLEGDDDRAWVTRATLDTLRAWAAQPGLVLTLSLRGATRPVMFRHQDAPVLETAMILFYGDPTAGNYYRITLKLMEV